MSRILVTGATGQLGADLLPLLDDHDVEATTRDQLDIGDRDSVLSAIWGLRPEVVVNCAAWTAVDACESDPDRAFRTNSMAVRHLAEGCRAVGAHLTTISTDYVFDGTKAGSYLEWDLPNPRSVYGESKLGGELEAGTGATIVRTSWVCGEHGNNMVKTVLRLIDEHPTLRFVDDQIGHPTFAADLAAVVARLALQRRPGVFHVTNQGAVSWFEFARLIAELAGADPARIEPISTAELDPPRPAPRPANSVLDNAALRLAGEPETRHFSAPLAELISSIR